jgi:hypothetical protein
LFDPRAYRVANPRLTDAVLEKTGFANHYDHYLEIGCTEARVAHFMLDPDWYIDHLPQDEQPAARAAGAFTHLLSSFDHAAATSAYFDPFGAARYPESRAKSPIWRGPRCITIWRAGPAAYDRTHFSNRLSVRYPDIAAAVDKGACRMRMHFAMHGAREMPTLAAGGLRHTARNPSVPSWMPASPRRVRAFPAHQLPPPERAAAGGYRPGHRSRVFRGKAVRFCRPVRAQAWISHHGHAGTECHVVCHGLAR